MSNSLDETRTNILVGIFGKVGGNRKNYDMVIGSKIDTFDKPSYDFLWNAQRKHFAKTGEIISWPILKTIISQNKKLTIDIKRLFLDETRKLFSKNEYRRVINNRLVKFSISELTSIRRQTEFANILHDHFIVANSGDVEDMEEAIQKTLAQLNRKLVYDRGDQDYEIHNLGETFEQRQALRKAEKESPDLYKKYRFAYYELNKYFPRGIRPGDCGLISGVSGVGKSITAIDVCKTAAAQGLNVALCISENSISQTTGRLDANITGVEYDLIQGYGFTEKDLKNFNNDFHKNIATAKRIEIIKVSPNNFTVMTINRAVQNLKAKGFKPDVIVIDSPDLMRPSIDIKIAGEHATRIASTAVYWEIKTYAVDQEYMIFCTSQLTRGAAKKGADVSAEDIADNYEKIRICDFQLIIYETLDLALSNQLGIKIGKNRDGEKPTNPVILMCDKSRMTFYNIDGSPGSFGGTAPAGISRLIPKKTTPTEESDDDEVEFIDVVA